MLGDKIQADILNTGYDEKVCLHYCSLCEQFEYCKGADCTYSARLGRHMMCEVFVPHWSVAKLIGLIP